MKRRLERIFRIGPHSSFTLVELLVVIGIITILAAVLLTAGNSAIKAALRTKAATMASQIQVASMAYYNDYSVYPLSTSQTTQALATFGTSDQTDWQNLIWALCGNINPYNGSVQTPTVSNTRSIQYLQLSRANIDANGIPLNPIAPVTPSYFNITMDATYCGLLSNVPSFSPGVMSTSSVITGGVYVWANCNSATGASNVNWWVHAP